MLDPIYLKSNKVKVYPSALRSGTDTTENSVRFNPEANLGVEENRNSRINALTDYRSFIIEAPDLQNSPESYKFKVCLEGYVFDLYIDKNYIEQLKDDGALKVNLNIKAGSLLSKVTDDKNVFTSEYNFYHLLNMKENLSKDSDFTSASLDISTDLAGDNATEDEYEFQGIALSNDILEGSSSSLCILIRDDTSQDFRINEGGFGKFTTKDIIYNLGDINIDGSTNHTLNEIIDNNGVAAAAKKLDHLVEIWGHQTDFAQEGDSEPSPIINGDLKNVGNIIPNPEGGPYDIGQPDNPFGNIYANTVIADSIQFKNSNVAAANQIMYLNEGQFTEGMTFYHGKVDPNTLSNSDFPSSPKPGDIYYQIQS